MGICLDGASSLELLRAERFRHAEPDYRVSEREVRLPPKWDILPDRTVPADSFPNAELLQRCIEGPLRELRQPIGLLVGSDGMRSKPSPQSRCSVCSLELPPGSFVRVTDGLFACAPELAFVRLAAHAGFTETLRAGFELCGSYAIAPCAPGGICRSAPPTQVRRIRDYCRACPSLRGIGLARRASAHLMDGSASPRETALAMLLTLPHRYGGYGLPRPELNAAPSAHRRGHRDSRQTGPFVPDLLWERAGVAVEYNSSGWHSKTSQAARDSRRLNALSMNGMAVYVVTDGLIRSVGDMDALAGEIARKLGVRTRRRDRDERWRTRQETLRTELDLPTDRD